MAIFSKSDDGDEMDGDSLWESRGFIASVIVVVAVVICGLAWLVLGGGGDDPNTNPTVDPTGVPTETPTVEPTGPPATADPTPTDPLPTDPVSPGASPRPGACTIKPGDQRMAATAPTGVFWRFEGGILVPFKPTVGPLVHDSSGVLSCFAHSPIGSVFAAMNSLAQAQDAQNAERVIRARVAPGPGRDRALADARLARISPTPFVGGKAQVQFVGYKYVDCSTNRCVLSVAVQSGAEVDKVAGLVVVMKWSGGDWKIDLRSDGSISGDPDVLGSLDGYVRFRGA
ncbi:PT domain-containing protein [Kribbella sp. NBC_01245]|uniref:PT domain-containing protein n=1 Tax=Kribbella sp. NBC_01245 TaxID=2903578 RepID=UPI002E2AECB2|nr:PT domain-containing protein [Kribbella sp. NBC_01245]